MLIVRDDDGTLAVDLQLPDGISRMRFRKRWRDFRLTVAVDHSEVTYTVHEGPDHEVAIRHGGQHLTLSTDAPTTVAVRVRKPLLPTPQQPPGREPLHRRTLARSQ